MNIGVESILPAISYRMFSVPMSADEVGDLWRWRGKTAVLSNADNMGDAVCGDLDDAARSERAHARAHIRTDWIDALVDFYEVDSTRTLLVIDSRVYGADASTLHWHIVGGGGLTPTSCATGTDVLRDSYNPYGIDPLSEVSTEAFHKNSMPVAFRSTLAPATPRIGICARLAI